MTETAVKVAIQMAANMPELNIVKLEDFISLVNIIQILLDYINQLAKVLSDLWDNITFTREMSEL